MDVLSKYDRAFLELVMIEEHGLLPQVCFFFFSSCFVISAFSFYVLVLFPVNHFL
jgi:hypothetical protein